MVYLCPSDVRMTVNNVCYKCLADLEPELHKLFCMLVSKSNSSKSLFKMPFVPNKLHSAKCFSNLSTIASIICFETRRSAIIFIKFEASRLKYFHTLCKFQPCPLKDILLVFGTLVYTAQANDLYYATSYLAL